MCSTSAMPTKATPSVPAVVHELPVTAPTTAQMIATATKKIVGFRRWRPYDTTVGMVPERFQAPIKAPTASRMNTAPRAVVTPPIAASRTDATVYPFLKATRPAKTALVRSAIWSGPFAASTPNSTIVSAIRTVSTTTGAIASRSVGTL